MLPRALWLRHDHKSIRGAAWVIVAGFVAIWAPGCSSSGPTTSEHGAGVSEVTKLTTTGDWDDVDASVIVGLDKAEAAQRSMTEVSPTERHYQFRTVLDQTGLLKVVQTKPGRAGESCEVEMWCRVEPLGDAAREQRIVREVARRLSHLRGVEFAPVR
jgi:hypothetical protein